MRVMSIFGFLNLESSAPTEPSLPATIHPVHGDWWAIDKRQLLLSPYPTSCSCRVSVVEGLERLRWQDHDPFLVVAVPRSLTEGVNQAEQVSELFWTSKFVY